MRIQDTSPLSGGNYWINGLLQGLERSNLFLHRGGAPTIGSHTRQLLPVTEGTQEIVLQLHRWGINTWADLLNPDGSITTELGQCPHGTFSLPTDMEILPPILQQGQFWYKTNDFNQPPQVIEIMEVTSEAYHYRVWRPTVQGMRHAVGRQVEWTAPSITAQSERWSIQGQPTVCSLTHRVLLGARKGFGQNRWSRTIHGAYRSISPSLPTTTNLPTLDDAIIPQLRRLQDQLRTLGPYTMYTDGGWEYGGDGMDAPFHPATDSPSHKGGGSIVFLTTDLGRIRQRMGRQETSLSDTLDYVAIQIDHGEVVGRGPNPQELLALLGALAITQRLDVLGLADKRIGSDCKSLVDYINEHRHTRLRNEVANSRSL